MFVLVCSRLVWPGLVLSGLALPGLVSTVYVLSGLNWSGLDPSGLVWSGLGCVAVQSVCLEVRTACSADARRTSYLLFFFFVKVTRWLANNIPVAVSFPITLDVDDMVIMWHF